MHCGTEIIMLSEKNLDQIHMLLSMQEEFMPV